MPDDFSISSAATPTFGVSTGPLPASTKVHIPGTLHPEIRVAMREIGAVGRRAVDPGL